MMSNMLISLLIILVVMIGHGAGSVPISGAKKVTPATSTIYKLTASNASGASAIRTVSIIVNAAGSGAR